MLLDLILPNITGWWEHKNYIGLQQVLSGCCLRSHMRQDTFQIPGWEVRAGLTAMTSSSSSSSSSNLCQGNYPIKVEWGCKPGKRSENKGQVEEIQYDWQIFSQEWLHAPTKGAAHTCENIQLWFTPIWQEKFMGRFLIHHQLKWEWPFQLNI